MSKPIHKNPFTGELLTFTEVTKTLRQTRDRLWSIADDKSGTMNTGIWLAIHPEAQQLSKALSYIETDIKRAALGFKETNNAGN